MAFDKLAFAARLTQEDLDNINYIFDVNGVPITPSDSYISVIRAIIEVAMRKTAPPIDDTKIKALAMQIDQAVKNTNLKDVELKQALEEKNDLQVNYENAVRRINEYEAQLADMNSALRDYEKQYHKALEIAEQKDQENEGLRRKVTDNVVIPLSALEKHLLDETCKSITKDTGKEQSPEKLLMWMFLQYTFKGAQDFYRRIFSSDNLRDLAKKFANNTVNTAVNTAEDN